MKGVAAARSFYIWADHDADLRSATAFVKASAERPAAIARPRGTAGLCTSRSARLTPSPDECHPDTQYE
jgi:hypothetical protein